MTDVRALEQTNREAVLTIENMAPRPVTLGVVLIIWSTFAAVFAYALNEAKGASESAAKLAVAQERLSVKLEAMEREANAIPGLRERLSILEREIAVARVQSTNPQLTTTLSAAQPTPRRDRKKQP